jgi:ubiquinone/menaquinone biosynthesis C-methylase UbiE
MLAPAATRPNCDRLAPYYRLLESITFGRAFQNARCAFLPEVTTARRALLCGDGDGRFLARLLQTNSTVTVDFVDLSAKMIELARQRVARLGPTYLERLRFFHQDVTEFSPPATASSAGYDLLATHFFLDCFAQQEIVQVVSRIAAWAAPQAKWLVSDVRQAPNSISKIWTRAAIRTLYAAFNSTTGLRLTKLPRYTEALTAAGCAPTQEKITAAGLLYSALWQCPSQRPHSENLP